MVGGLRKEEERNRERKRWGQKERTKMFSPQIHILQTPER
jgi:hypothetical protein